MKIKTGLKEFLIYELFKSSFVTNTRIKDELFFLAFLALISLNFV